MFVYGVGFGMWMRVGCPCPPIRNDIVTLRHLFNLLLHERFLQLQVTLAIADVERPLNFFYYWQIFNLGPNEFVHYWRISLTLAPVIAGCNCISVLGMRQLHKWYALA